MNTSKLVIFDFDGVIVNTFSFAYEINKNQFGIAEEEYRKKFEGNIYKAKSTASELKAISPDFDFFALYTPQLMVSTPETGIIESIRQLSEQYSLAIVSSTVTNIINDYLEKIEARKYFQEILGADIEKSKIIKINNLLEKYGRLPSEVVFITDTSGDVKETEQCQVKSIAVTWGYHSQATLEKAHPFRVIDNPEQLADAVRDCFAG